MSKVQYQELARQWQLFAEKNPNSAFAQIMVYEAFYNSGEQNADKLQTFITESLEIDPQCPEALAAAMGTALRHGKPLGTQIDCYEYGLKAIQIAPNWPRPHAVLYVLATRLNRPDEARDHLKAMLEKGFFSPALIDYGFNMLISAEPGGIIITNGDNDSFPCLALQAGRNIRPDVTVANLSLMTLQPIALQYLTQPSEGFEAAISREKFDSLEQAFFDDRKIYGYMFGNILLEYLCNQASTGILNRPVYLAVTIVPDATARCSSALSLEGLLQRIIPGTPDPQQQPMTNISKTLYLFSQRYRLDSATDLATNWQQVPAHLQLINNYTNILFRLGYDAAAIDDFKTMEFGFDESLKIASYHKDQTTMKAILDYWIKLDPKSEKAELWQKEIR